MVIKMFRELLYKLAYPLFAKEVEAYHRLNNAILGINRWCASDYKASVISTHLLQVRDDLVTHHDDAFRERLRAIDKPVTVTRVSNPESRQPVASNPAPSSNTSQRHWQEDNTWANYPKPSFGCSSDLNSSSSSSSDSSSSSSSSSCGGD